MLKSHPDAGYIIERERDSTLYILSATSLQGSARSR